MQMVNDRALTEIEEIRALSAIRRALSSFFSLDPTIRAASCVPIPSPISVAESKAPDVTFFL